MVASGRRVTAVDLNHLRYFQTIAQCGSMTAAARVLRVSQPTLTVAMKNLEERLGTTLLLRNRNGVSLTSTGTELLQHASEVFALIERAEQRILGLETDEVGHFVIGCHESLGAYFLPEFMIEFLAASPRVEIALWNGSSPAVAEAVLGRQVHFGLIVNPIPHPELVLVELFKDAVDLFVCTGSPAPGDPRASAPESGVENLASAHARLKAGPLVHAGRIQQCQDLIHRLSADGLMPARTLSCGDLELVKSLALAGLGVALLPRRVAAYGQPGRLRRLHPSLPYIPDTIYLIYRADIHRTRALIKVKDALIKHGRKLEGQGA
jgi:DNA-binding transcriptional LysR family regulator